MSATTTTTSTSLITPKGTISYPQLFQPRIPPNSKPGTDGRYSCIIMFRKDVDLKALKTAALKVAVDKWGREKVEALLKDGKLKLGFRTDLASKGWDADLYGTYISPWTKQQPGVVDRFKGPDGKALPIRDPNVIYAGAEVRASVRPFAYDTDGNKGVAFGLGNIQKTGEGDRLDGRRAAADEFEATEEAPDTIGLDAAFGAASGGTAGPSSGNAAADELAALLG